MAELNGTAIKASDPVTIDEIAISPNDSQQLPALARNVGLLSTAYLSGEASARLQLLEATESLLAALETPRETILRYCWRNATFAMIETAVDLGIFRLLSESDRPKSVVELSTATGADLQLLQRIMKHLAAVGVVAETGLDQYARNGVSQTLSCTKYSDAIRTITGTTHRVILATPQFLQQTDYRNPSDGLHSPFQLGFGTKASFFEFLAQDPVVGAQFNNLMSVYHQGRASWMDPGFYPVQRLLEGVQVGTDDVLLVDVGGGKGHDLQEFRTKGPRVPGRLILQDQPAVIAEATGLHASIETMAHDFFGEQPIKGARAYFLHSVLHDWSEDVCLKILARLKAVMTPGYSRLLINENVVADTGAHWQATALDFIMLSDLAGAERTESQWRGLLEAAGFTVLRIWTADKWSESLIECELVTPATPREFNL
ncbi:S-adenosyl-L-methionine-dependent methyltransferase [Aspergillus ellipticus CBS 707.79]|uniref:S-adenosyl-L-methionine-dependent methyltransferase n=1 Tax=Aspergillus ellipticus CBS 707.79 TaxID=1448320 RepID=A0A319D461_9EURO|nr:S-adenosyl-L-methionine-dependent methyltransferase [Aspergillus ellipticus CBS 707.79]